MKKILITIGALAAVAAIGMFVVKPLLFPAKFTWSNIDWLNRTVHYNYPGGSGIADWKQLSKDNSAFTIQKGNITYSIKATGDSLDMSVTKNGETIRSTTVDFAKRQVRSEGKMEQFA